MHLVAEKPVLSDLTEMRAIENWRIVMTSSNFFYKNHSIRFCLISIFAYCWKQNELFDSQKFPDCCFIDKKACFSYDLMQIL